jgi:hypothetical protein
MRRGVVFEPFGGQAASHTPSNWNHEVNLKFNLFKGLPEETIASIREAAATAAAATAAQATPISPASSNSSTTSNPESPETPASVSTSLSHSLDVVVSTMSFTSDTLITASVPLYRTIDEIGDINVSHLLRILSMILCGSNDKEMSNWPWRVVFLSNLFASVTSVTFALNPILLDLYPLHVFNFLVQLLWWICFTMCLFKSPSLVRDENSAEARQRGVTYEGALDKIAASSDNDGHIPICHSCHVCKPLRSKHCKILRRCVNKFDHFW